MTIGSALSPDEIDARRQLVALAEAMLIGEVSYFDGAPKVCALQCRVGGVQSGDPDFEAFDVISSETDHLPIPTIGHLWSASALQRVQPEMVHTEAWAKDFAPKACVSLIARFKINDS
jgi:hypothetical protein